MASKSERLITEALGYFDAANLTNISFSSTSASGILDANTTYRVIATEDCYLRLDAPLGAPVADSNDMLMVGGLPEVFVTTANATAVQVIRKDTDGVLQLTPMLTRGK